MTEIAIVRHPETVANVQGRFVGRGDSEITERGREQILALTETMDAWRPGVVCSSPLGRALITAKAIVPCGTPVRVLGGLQEIDFGRAEGLTWQEAVSAGIEVDYLRNGAARTGAPSTERRGPENGRVAPGGETWDAFECRVLEAASLAETAGDRVAVVTHGGVFRVLLAHWLGVPMSSSWNFFVGNGAVATLRVEDGTGVLLSLRQPE
ncbi:MAG: histidine phosphatase family protein [Coriobacteriales bacterium]|nr:histidine phosphatase family protein [Actinomycetes bacterium]